MKYLLVQYYIILIGVEGGDSGGMSETDEISQRRFSDGDSSSLTPRKASAWNGDHSGIML